MAKISFFGDFIAKDPENIIFSQEIISLLKDSSLNVVNFEAPVQSPDVCLPIPKSGPSLSQSHLSPSVLEKNNFNVISFANNHIMDYGYQSCQYSKSLFTKADVLGVGSAEEAYCAHYYTVEDVKIGIIALAQQEFGAIDISGDIDYGYAWVNHPQVPAIIASSKQKCDYLFVYCHCGIEDIEIPLPEWRVIYKSFIDYGASAVIASHPHRVQGYEYYKGSPIIYSLGNFFFDKDGLPEFQYHGLIASINVDKNGSLSLEFVYTKKEGNEIATDTNPTHLEELNQLLEEPEYFQRVKQTTLEMMPLYMHYYRIAVNGFTSMWHFKEFANAIRSSFHKDIDSILLLNSIRCESHRYLFSRGLKYLANSNY